MVQIKKPNYDLPPEGVDLPGPVYHSGASHWVEYNRRNLTVVTWCRVGTERQFKLKTRVRPMSHDEVIHSKLHGYSREAVLRAYGVELSDLQHPRIPYQKPSLFRRFLNKVF